LCRGERARLVAHFAIVEREKWARKNYSIRHKRRLTLPCARLARECRHILQKPSITVFERSYRIELARQFIAARNVRSEIDFGTAN